MMNDKLGLSPIKSLVLLVIGTFFGGIAGLLAILSCYFMLGFGGQETAEKHGISVFSAVRIGGVLIVLYVLLNAFFQVWALKVNIPRSISGVVLVGALPFFLIGLFEDLRGVLSAERRLVLMLAAAAIIVTYEPRFVLGQLGVWWLDEIILSNSLSAGVFSVLCLAFLPNAFNTADGANGLVSALAMSTVLTLATLAPAPLGEFLRSVAAACSLFLIYNLSTGRFFLGDGGAYFLGALVGLSLMVIANHTQASAWMLASLIFYPVFDLIFSMVRRLGSGASPFSPDNAHLHNLLFGMLSKGKLSARHANTLTGLLIVMLFNGVPVSVFLADFLSAKSEVWFLLYWLMSSVYVVLWFSLKHCIVASRELS